MSKNAMAGAVTLCGVGLCMIGGAMMMQNGQQAHAAAGSMPTVAAAVAATANAQAEPTVVWYGVTTANGTAPYLLRAWSDGTIEAKIFGLVVNYGPCTEASQFCSGPWQVISSPGAGLRSAADINADELVDGADLASVLGNWGDAPRPPFPPSDCPLNLINP